MISSFYNSIELYSYSSIIYFSAPTKISHIHPEEMLLITENHCVNITSKTVPPDGFDRTVMFPSCTLTIS